jgi:hypothetical protein
VATAVFFQAWPEQFRAAERWLIPIGTSFLDVLEAIRANHHNLIIACVNGIRTAPKRFVAGEAWCGVGHVDLGVRDA